VLKSLICIRILVQAQELTFGLCIGGNWVVAWNEFRMHLNVKVICECGKYI